MKKCGDLSIAGRQSVVAGLMVNGITTARRNLCRSWVGVQSRVILLACDLETMGVLGMQWAGERVTQR